MTAAPAAIQIHAREDTGTLRSLGPKVEATLAKLARRIHRKRREHLYVVDRDGAVLVHVRGTKDRSKVPTEMLAAIRKYPGRFVVLHNHPGGKTFSNQDVVNAVTRGYREARVVTPKGRVYRLQPIGRTVPVVFADAAAGAYLRLKENGEKPSKRWLNKYRARLYAQGLHHEPVMQYGVEKLPARKNPSTPEGCHACGCCADYTMHRGRP